VVPRRYPVDQHHSNAATAFRSPHVQCRNANRQCASTVRSVRVSWPGGEAAATRVYGTR